MLISFLKLIKFRLSAAVTFSAAAGYLVCATDFHWSRFAAMVAGVYLLSGGSSALNQYHESATDRLMERTALRPIPSGDISPVAAVATALALMLTGLAALAVFTNITAALLGLFNILLYNFVYTPLKRRTWLALLPGALVGAIPPLIGFTAAGGALFALPAVFLSLFLFLWQFPHFWLLQIEYRNDYILGGFSGFIRFPRQSAKRIAILLSVVLMSTLIMLAEFFGVTAGPGFSRFLSAVTIALIVSFILIMKASEGRQDYGSQSKLLLKILNIYSFIILVTVIIAAYR